MISESRLLNSQYARAATKLEEFILTIKIKATQIGIKKPIEIKPSVDLQIESSKIGRMMVQANVDSLRQQVEEERLKETEDSENESESTKTELEKMEDQLLELEKQQKELDKEKEIVESSFNFLKNVLGLTDEQVKSAHRNLADYTQLMEYVSYVVARIKGSSDKQIEALAKKEEIIQKEKDPKKD